MTDPFPILTTFLENLLLYLIYIGLILAAISAVVAGILFLPIFGFGERQSSIGSTALRLTAIGVIVIVLAVPARNALLAHFPLPAGIPQATPIPLTTPGAVQTPGPTPGH